MATLDPSLVVKPVPFVNASLVALGICIWLFSRWISARRLKLPPGPRPDPFIGNIRQLSFDNQEVRFAEWGAAFGMCLHCHHTCPFTLPPTGDIVYFQVFGRSMIVLNSLKAAQDLMEKRSLNYSCRPRFVLIVEMCDRFHSNSLNRPHVFLTGWVGMHPFPNSHMAPASANNAV